MKKNSKSKLVGLLPIALVATMISAPNAFAEESNNVGSWKSANVAELIDAQGQYSNLDPELSYLAEDWAQSLEYINSIPDRVLKEGDLAKNAWVAKNPSKFDIKNGEVRPYASIWSCTVAITLVVGSTLVSAAKLLKIKKYIAQLGGVKEAVQAMWGASFSYEKMQAVGGALAALAAEIIGITSIRESCFE